MTTFNVTAHTATEVADTMNTMFAEGTMTTVFGDKVRSSHGAPVARAWQNGTVSVTVQARTTRGTTDRFFKVGSTVTVA